MRAIYTILICALVWCCSIKVCVAQNDTIYDPPSIKPFTLADIAYSYYRPNSVSGFLGSEDYKASEFQASIVLPIVFNQKRYVIIAGFQFRYLNAGLSSKSDENRIFPHSLITYRANLGYIHRFKNRPQWRLINVVSPMLTGDFKAESALDNFSLEYNIIAQKRFRDNLEVGLGINYNYQLSEHLFLPLASVSYRKNRWLTTVLIPSYAKQFYTLKNKQRIGFSILIENDNFNTAASDLPNLNLTSFRQVKILFGSEYVAPIYKIFHLYAIAGVSVFNDTYFRLNDADTHFELDTQPQFFVRAGIRLLK